MEQNNKKGKICEVDKKRAKVVSDEGLQVVVRFYSSKKILKVVKDNVRFFDDSDMAI